MNQAAVYYLPSEFTTKNQKLMGRHSASEGMLRAMAACPDLDRLHAYVSSDKSYQFFEKEFSPKRPSNTYIEKILWQQLDKLEQAELLMLSDPNLAQHAWNRLRVGVKEYSLCGITHTICSDGAMNLLGSVLHAPVYEWDALICTSKCVKDSVDNVFNAVSEYMRDRFDVQKSITKPMCPVIPLGVDCDTYQIPLEEKENYRTEWRKRMGLSEDTLVFLFFGRLSFHAKANPYAMCRVLEKVAQKTKKKIALVQAGWFANDPIKKAFIECANKISPSIKCLFLDGRNPEVRKSIWFSADVFMSLVDNIQETFGLTPLEAKAAGLPVVVSDWDGYRDTVRHEIDGFMIPTLMPEQGELGLNLINRFESGLDNYDQYIGNASQCISVDIEAAVKAVETLVEFPEKRKEMGEAAAKHAKEGFDWQVVMKQYIELWNEQKARRKNQTNVDIKRKVNPLREDPFKIFDSYPTDTLHDKTLLSVNQDFEIEAVFDIAKLSVFNFGIPKPERLLNEIFIAVKNNEGFDWGKLKSEAKNKVHAERLVLWLIKIGALKVTNQS